MCNAYKRLAVAGIVLYNPEIKRLKENIEAIISQVDKIVLVDNGSCNIEEVEVLIKEYFIELIKNEQNLGIAAALNQIFRWADEKKYKWVLTLDQDSVCKKGLINCYLKYANIENVAQISSQFIEKGSKNRKKCVSEQKYTFAKGCITSGCFLKTQAWKEVGGFDETMFIDYVDFDISFALDKFGWKTIIVNFDGFEHEIGKLNRKKFLWKNIELREHSAFRKYYIFRNKIYLLRKYPDKMQVAKEIKLLLKFLIYILVFESERHEKLFTALKGLKDGYSMPINYQWLTDIQMSSYGDKK